MSKLDMEHELAKKELSTSCVEMLEAVYDNIASYRYSYMMSNHTMEYVHTLFIDSDITLEIRSAIKSSSRYAKLIFEEDIVYPPVESCSSVIDKIVEYIAYAESKKDISSVYEQSNVISLITSKIKNK